MSRFGSPPAPTAAPSRSASSTADQESARADREAVFAPFQRRDDHTTGNGQGVGLGLAIARGFLEAMHGASRWMTRREAASSRPSNSPDCARPQ